tara:strand:+ start:1022 stop:1270 length:249 start_codon:yes stop_codon:yes gene_type:complete
MNKKQIKMANKPRYKHDCTCAFVGFYKNYDLYCCSEVHLVVRYGDNGADYSSCSINLVERSTFPEETKKALLHAKEKHLKLL